METSRAELERSADAARDSGRDEDAIRIYEALIDHDLREGSLARAMAVYQKVILWRPRDASLHDTLARRIADARDALVSPEGASVIPRSALFEGVPRDELSGILAKMKSARYSTGTEIVREGDAGDSLFLLTSGTVSVYTRDDGMDVRLAVLLPGNFFGEVSLLTSRPRTATVIADSVVDVLELSREAVEELRRRYAHVDRALGEFHRLRAEKTVEALIDRRRKK